MKTEKELRKNFKIIHKGNIISLIFTRVALNMEDNVGQTKLIEADFLKIATENPEVVFQVIINLLQTEHKNYFAKESRQIFSRLAQHKQIGKVAVISRNPFYKFLVNSIVKGTNLGNRCKCFSSQEEAEKCLNS